MRFLRRIEKSVDDRLRSIFAGGNQEERSSEAIELYRDALDQIAARATVGKRGDRVFPFDRIRIELQAEKADRKALLEALFAETQLAEDVQATLLEAGVVLPQGLGIEITYPENAVVEMRVICEKAPLANASAQAGSASGAESFPLIPVLVRTLNGEASDGHFVMDRPWVSIGRVNEVTDALGRAIRRNDLYFPDESNEINATVSRAHAHFRFDPETGEWRVYDDGSSLGTILFRDGRRIEVPAHATRGVMLRPGDELYLGQVRLRLETL